MVNSEVQQLRSQGLTDEMIMEELTRKGMSADDANIAISENGSLPPPIQSPVGFASPHPPEDASLYERIEDIAESMIDEKWDDLISEVKKIVEWKESIEEKNTRMQAELDKLKEDFKTLHQGVLGKLENYDERMQDVGTELKAVGKVFKDVIPEFVDGVKELRRITKKN